MQAQTHHLRSERGQAIVLIVFAIVGLIGITALAVDGGLYYATRRQVQNAADAALASIRGENYQSAAYASAEQNGYNNDGEQSKVQVHNPPTSAPTSGRS
mgnify:CR=1 FL=1